MNNDEEEGEIGGLGNNNAISKAGTTSSNNGPPSGPQPPLHHNGPPDNNNNPFRPRFPPSHGRIGGGGGRHFHGIGYRGVKREGTLGGRGNFPSGRGGRGGDFRGGGGGGTSDPPFREEPPFRSDSFNRPGFREGAPIPFRNVERGRSGSVSLHREGSFGGGPPVPFNREGSFSGPPREYNAPFAGSGGGGAPVPDREGSFGRDAPPRDGPPRGPPFRREGGPPPFRRGESQSSFSDTGHPPPRPFAGEHVWRESITPLQGGPPPPQDPRRPTDPRRRSSQDLGGLAAGAIDSGPPAGLGSFRNMSDPPIANPQPPAGRRLSSYSSLADSSTMPGSLVPSSEPLDQGFRSPAARRNTAPEYVNSGPSGPGSSGGVTANNPTRNPSWSPLVERHSGPRPEDAAPPLAPLLSNRGPPVPFRENPRGPESVSSGSRPLVVAPRDRNLQEEADTFGRAQGSATFPISRNSPSSKTTPIKAFGGTGSGPVSSAPIPAVVEHKVSNGTEVAPPAVTSNEIPIASSAGAPAPAPPALMPLLTSSLGEGEVVERAETAVLHLSKVLLDASIGSASGLSQLPAKQQIMAAVTQIESQIKIAQSKLEGAQEEHKQGVQEEARQEERERKRVEEKEAQLILEEKERRQEEERLERDLRTHGLQKVMDQHKAEFDSARQAFEDLTLQIIQNATHTLEQDYNLEAQIAQAKQDLNKDVVKARLSMEKARSNSLKVEAKLAAAMTEYETLLAEAKAQEDSDATRKTKQCSEMTVLVERIMSENQRKAQQAQVLAFAMASENDDTFDAGTGPKDPTYGKSFEEWSVLTKQVTGFGDALFSDPSETPYFQQNENSHSLLAPSVKEYIRYYKNKLIEEWTVLAEEYGVRKRLYEKQQRRLAKKARSGSVSVSRKSIMAGDTESAPSSVAQGIDRSNILGSGGRPSSNPYRRARRGNEVRSEYEQEQIIAEIAAKEAMEKRITHGGCKVPHQLSCLERGITASFVQTFNSHRVDDMKKEAEEAQMDNIWTDMEKCIFLDRFLQFPKDFRRIASFLRNKTTKDCIAFYYDSKQTVPYKAALKEHVMRRKRKGDYATWDASIQAAISVGATVTAGESEDKPVFFALPSSDRTYRTLHLHPLRRKTLDPMPIDHKAARMYERERTEETKGKGMKRVRDPLFSLDKHQTKFLRRPSQEQSPGKPAEDDQKMEIEDASESPLSPIKKTPQKWTAAEKNIFVETLEQHGRDWAKLAQAVGTKNEKQIKNFYYDWKKGKSRPITEKKNKKEKPVKNEKLPKSAVETDEMQHSAAEETADDTPEAETGPERRDSHGDMMSQAATMAELRAQAEAATVRERDVMQMHNPSGTDGDYGGNNALLQRLLRQQLQQQQQQQPQSALQQLLTQQHLQRESQLNQLSLDDARRLLSHHQNQPTSVVSNMLGSQWMLQGPGGGLASNAITAALRGESSGLAGLSDMGDLQRLLQIQRASQGTNFQNQQQSQLALLLGGGGDMGTSTNGNLSAVLLQQLANGQNGGPVPDPNDHLSSLASAHHLLGFGAGSGGGNNLANAFYLQASGGGMDSSGVSDAFSLLARSMQRNDGAGRGFGRPDGTGRFS